MRSISLTAILHNLSSHYFNITDSINHINIPRDREILSYNLDVHNIHRQPIKWYIKKYNCLF